MEKELRQEISPEVVSDIEKKLRYISHIIKRKGREILRHYSITPPQFLALQWLYDEGDMTIGDLSKKMHLAFSTTTDIIDRLEKNGLVKRIKDKDDRRVVQIQLLAEGKSIISEVIKKRQLYLSEILSEYSQEDVRRLQSELAKLLDKMKD